MQQGAACDVSSPGEQSGVLCDGLLLHGWLQLQGCLQLGVNMTAALLLQQLCNSRHGRAFRLAAAVLSRAAGPSQLPPLPGSCCPPPLQLSAARPAR